VAERADCLADLLEVDLAAIAAGDVLLEALVLFRRERALEVVRHELHELAATELFDLCVHVHVPASCRYPSSAARTFERARWRRTR
jgi:hypothetical protein